LLCRRRKWVEEWKVEKLIGHHYVDGQGFFFTVEWAASKNKKWENSVEPESGISKSLIKSYFAGKQLLLSQNVLVDIGPLVKQTRKKVATTVALAKTQARPRLHVVPLEAFTHSALAFQLLEMARKPSNLVGMLGSSEDDVRSERRLPLIYTKDEDDGVEVYQVNYEKMADIGNFCAFQSFLGLETGIEALRFDMGRKHNNDFMLVAMPMAFKVVLNRDDDLATTTLEFPTVHGNGMFGTITPAPMLRGMLKEEKHFNTAVRYVKKFLPAAHPLVVKGWKRLPAAHSLSKKQAVPVGQWSDYGSSDEDA